MLEVLLILYILIDVKKNSNEENGVVLSRRALQVFFLFYWATFIVCLALAGFPKEIVYLRNNPWHALAGLTACSASGYLGYLIFKSSIRKNKL